MARANIDDCNLLRFPKMESPEGNLTFVEGTNHIPFDIKRVFYIYDIPTLANRGSHAHYALHQMLICISGSCDVTVSDGKDSKTVNINCPWKGLYVPPMIWASQEKFDPGSILLVLASDNYIESDYIRDYKKFILAKNFE